MSGIGKELRESFDKKARLMRRSGSPGIEGLFRSGKSRNQVRDVYEKPISQTREYRTHGKQKLMKGSKSLLTQSAKSSMGGAGMMYGGVLALLGELMFPKKTASDEQQKKHKQDAGY